MPFVDEIRVIRHNSCLYSLCTKDIGGKGIYPYVLKEMNIEDIRLPCLIVLFL